MGGGDRMNPLKWGMMRWKTHERAPFAIVPISTFITCGRHLKGFPVKQ